MKHICIALPEGAASIGCIEGAAKLFNIANDFLIRRQLPAGFSVSLVAADKNPRLYDGMFMVSPNYDIHDDFPCDLLILPAVNGNMNEVVESNRSLTAWAADRHRHGTELASLCVGAFLLASTGLLNGKKCSSHWIAEHDFRRMFPGVNLVSHQVITDENGLYSSGGANSFWNLLLHILEKYTDRELAIALSKYFEIDIGRDDQSPFFIFSGQRQHDDDAVRKTQEYIETNYRARINVDDLSEKFAVGRRSLERRFKKATTYSIAEYIQRVKVEAAKKYFETRSRNVNEIMFEVGYSDTKAFRNVFRKHTGLSPLEYRNRYRRELAA